MNQCAGRQEYRKGSPDPEISVVVSEVAIQTELPIQKLPRQPIKTPKLQPNIHASSEKCMQNDNIYPKHATKSKASALKTMLIKDHRVQLFLYNTVETPSKYPPKRWPTIQVCFQIRILLPNHTRKTIPQDLNTPSKSNTSS